MSHWTSFSIGAIMACALIYGAGEIAAWIAGGPPSCSIQGLASWLWPLVAIICVFNTWTLERIRKLHDDLRRVG